MTNIEKETKENKKVNESKEIKEKIMPLGVDCGNFFTKTSKGVKFRSAITLTVDELSELKETHIVNFKNRDYTVGTGKALNFDTKYFEETFKVLILTAIAESFDESSIKCNLTIGLPIYLHRNKKLVENIQKHIANFGTNEIIVDNKKKSITISNCNIWIESAIIFYDYDKYSKDTFLVTDIGGYSVDILAIRDGKVTGSESLTLGTFNLINDILKQINQIYKSDVRSGEEILKSMISGNDFKINDKSIDMDLVKDMSRIYCQDIFSELNQRFPLNEYKLLFIGGGSALLQEFLETFNSYYYIQILEQPEFINAFTYENISRNREV